MKKLLALFSFLIFTSVINAQLIYDWSQEVNQYSVGGISQYITCKDNSDNIIVSGLILGAIDMDPTAGQQAILASTQLTPSPAVYDLLIAKYDADGTLLFTKQYFKGSSFLQIVDMRTDDQNNIYVLRSNSYTKFSANGDSLYSRNFGTNVTFYDFDINSQNDVILTGYYQNAVDFDLGAGSSNFSNADFQYFILNYNSAGDFSFVKELANTSTGNYSLGKICLDASDNIYIAGVLASTIDFDPTAGNNSVTGNGYDQVFAKYNSLGALQYVKKITGAVNNYYYTNQMEVDNLGNLILLGNIKGTVDLDPSGTTVNATGTDDIIFIKYSSSGNYVLNKIVGAIGTLGMALSVDANNNYCIASIFNGTNDFDPNAGTFNLTTSAPNVFVASYSSTGNLNFATQRSPVVSENYYNIWNDSNNNIILTVFHSGLLMAEYSSTGSINWENNWLYAIGGVAVGSGNDNVYCVTKDASGNKYIGGSYEGALSFGSLNPFINLTTTTNASGFFAKYDNSGNCLFANKLTGQAIVKDIKVDANGNIYLCGTFSATVDFDPSGGTSNLVSLGGTDVFFAKYDNNGNLLFVKVIAGSGSEDALSIAIDNSSNIYIGGNFAGTTDFDPGAGSQNFVSSGFDGYFAKYNSSGNFLFIKQLGGSGNDYVNSIALDGSGNILATGTFTGITDLDPGTGTTSFTAPASSSDVFIAKYSTTGALVFAKQIGGTSNEYGTKLLVDASNNIYVSGYFSGTADFDPSATTQNLVSSGGEDGFFMKLTSTGNYSYAKKIGGTGNDRVLSIALDQSANLNVGGFYNSTADFDPSVANLFLVSSGSTDAFIGRYNAFGDLIFAKKIGSSAADEVTSIHVDNSATLLVAGTFSGTADVDVSDVNQLVINGEQGKDIFIAQYQQSFFTIDTTIIKGSVTCYTDTDGAAAVTPIGNQPPYTYLWSPTGDTDSLVTNLPIGSHTVTVTDNFGLTMSTVITIGGPASALSASVGSLTNVSCFGGSNGFASINASGGGAPYTYTWSPSSGSLSSSSSLSAAVYTVTVQDTYGCQENVNFTITSPPQINLSVVSQLNVSCNGGNNGVASLSATGGSGGFSYSWSPGSYTTSLVTGLSANIYTVTVFDVNGCLAQTNVNITQPAVLSASISNLVPVTCFNATNGSATVSATGGTTPYNYSWTPSGGTAAVANNLGTGIYTVTVTDNKGCTANTTANIQYLPQTQEICLVTSDSATATYNILVWEKPANIAIVDSFFIYREVTTNVFQKLGAVHRDSLSEYDDLGANPNSTSYKYRITVLDTCGGESDPGLYHKSIHLQYFGLGNFQWTFYEIENTTNQVASYNFYRDDNSTGNFVLQQIIPGTNNSYTDVNYTSFPNASYRVDVNWINGQVCTSTMRYDGNGNNEVFGPVNTTRSNIKTPTSIGIVDANVEQLFAIVPNPFVDELLIQSPFSKTYELNVIDELGRVVFSEKCSGDKSISTSNFAPACYFVEIKFADKIIRKKLMKM